MISPVEHAELFAESIREFDGMAELYYTHGDFKRIVSCYQNIQELYRKAEQEEEKDKIGKILKDLEPLYQGLPSKIGNRIVIFTLRELQERPSTTAQLGKGIFWDIEDPALEILGYKLDPKRFSFIKEKLDNYKRSAYKWLRTMEKRGWIARTGRKKAGIVWKLLPEGLKETYRRELNLSPEQIEEGVNREYAWLEKRWRDKEDN